MNILHFLVHATDGLGGGYRRNTPSGVLKSAEHRQRIPDDEHGHVSGENAVSGVYRSIVPWDRGHHLSGRAKISALVHLIGDLRSRMLASKVELLLLLLFSHIN